MMIDGTRVYLTVIIVFILVILGSSVTLLYKTGAIFPPKVPQNIEELEQWSEGKLFRLIRELECDRLPWKDIPEELQELDRICDTVSDIWNRKYKANKMKGLADDAREKLKHLYKAPKPLPE